MPGGETYLTQVEEGLDTAIASARRTREHPANVMLRTCDRQTLKEGTGTAWREFLSDTLSASDASETGDYDNPQELDGSVLSATPTLVICQTFIGDRVQLRLNPKAYATFGMLAQDAMSRKKDQDLLLIFATATITLAGTGQTFTSGHIRAAAERIRADATEPWSGKLCWVGHGYAKADIDNEILSGVGSYPLPEGMTGRVFADGYEGRIDAVEIYVDGLVAVDSTPDVRGAVYASGEGGAIVCVQGKSPWMSKRYEPQRGYGGWNVWHKDEYTVVERSPGNWMFSTLSDGTAPTS